MALDLLSSLVAGLIQGTAEWLPVSSKSLVMFYFLNMGIPAQQAFSMAVYSHIGTLCAAAVVLRKEILDLAKKTFALAKKPEKFHLLLAPNSREMGIGMVGFVIAALILTGIVGLPLYKFLKDYLALGESYIALLMGVLLVATAIVLFKTNRKGERVESEANSIDGAVTGALQGLATLPGVSRSGITMFGLGLRGFSVESAARLSFLLSIPTVFFAEIFFAVVLDKMQYLPPLDVLLAINVSSFVFGMLSMEALLAVVKRMNFWKACIALALVYFAWGIFRMGAGAVAGGYT
jgi:undecaprenyl-diphosphatase